MKELRFKEYINFSELSQDAFNLVEYVKNNTNDMTDSEKISYARKTFNKAILNSFIIIGHLDEKYYKLVIKTTKNHKENFVKSLHLLNKERYLKY